MGVLSEVIVIYRPQSETGRDHDPCGMDLSEGRLRLSGPGGVEDVYRLRKGSVKRWNGHAWFSMVYEDNGLSGVLDDRKLADGHLVLTGIPIDGSCHAIPNLASRAMGGVPPGTPVSEDVATSAPHAPPPQAASTPCDAKLAPAGPSTAPARLPTPSDRKRLDGGEKQGANGGDVEHSASSKPLKKAWLASPADGLQGALPVLAPTTPGPDPSAAPSQVDAECPSLPPATASVAPVTADDNRDPPASHIYVDCQACFPGGPSLQAALRAARDGDIVHVWGVHHGPFVMSVRGVTLKAGKDPAKSHKACKHGCRLDCPLENTGGPLVSQGPGQGRHQGRNVPTVAILADDIRILGEGHMTILVAEWDGRDSADPSRAPRQCAVVVADRVRNAFLKCVEVLPGERGQPPAPEEDDWVSAGIYFCNRSTGCVDSCHVRGILGNGIEAHLLCEIYIRESYGLSCRHSGAWLNWTGPCTVDNCTFSDNSFNGCSVSALMPCAVVNSAFGGNGRDAVLLDWPGNDGDPYPETCSLDKVGHIVSGCTVRNNLAGGIRNNRANKISSLLVDNVIKCNKESGVWFNCPNRGELVNCHTFGFRKSILRGNRIDGNLYVGVAVDKHLPKGFVMSEAELVKENKIGEGNKMGRGCYECYTIF
eukprot:jgi/Mesvir1/27841/Mv07517-RA.1